MNMFPSFGQTVARRLFLGVLLAGFCVARLMALQGTVLTPVTFTSPAGSTVRFSLYLPPGYTDGSARYPVVYHLHGIGGTHNGNQISSVPASHEAAVAAGLIEPAIIVFPDGYDDSFWADSANSAKQAERDVLDIIRQVDANYRTRASRLSRAIEGFSMGGFGAAKFATKYPDRFCVCVIYDGALLKWPVVQQRHASVASEVFNNSSARFDQFSAWHWTPANAEALRSGVPFRQVVGALTANNREFRDTLVASGITPSYVETGAPHNLQPLLDQGGAESWAFIGAAFAKAGNGIPPPPTVPVVTPPPAAAPKTFAGNAGLYGLLTTNIAATSSQVTTFLNHADFAGVSARTYWRDLEPTQGAYNWSYYDAVIAATQAKGKRVVLRLEAAWASPQWVLDAVQAAGGPLYEYYEKHQETTPDVKERMPAPWDPTYLAHWKTFVVALGARYNGSPAVAGVLITGCSRSSEMYLPTPEDGGPDWKAAPFSYTPEKLTVAWEGVIDTFAGAFPDKPVGLSLSKPLEDDGVVQAVAAYGSIEYPWHFYVKISYWGNANDSAYYPTAALSAVADEYTHGGLEPAGAAQSDATAAAIVAAISWHTLGIFEVYQAQRDNFATLKAAIDTRRTMIERMTFAATAGVGSAQLTWTITSPNPYPQGISILRRADDFPAGIGDAKAVTVFTGNGSGNQSDTGLSSQTTYYSVYDKANGYTLAQAAVKPTASTPAPPPTPTSPPTPPPSGGSGGGGAPSLWFVALLAAVAALRRTKHRCGQGPR